MKYTIDILLRAIDNLDTAYAMRVLRGKVPKDSEHAITNRKRVEELRKAISILESNL